MKLVFAGGLLWTENMDYVWEDGSEVPIFLVREGARSVLQEGQSIHIVDLGPTPTSVHPVGKSWKVTKATRVLNAVGDLIGQTIETEPINPSPPVKMLEIARRADEGEFDREPCRACDGCGKVADTTDQEPWTTWTSLPLHSAIAVTSGLVKPITCPTCLGSGKRKR